MKNSMKHKTRSLEFNVFVAGALPRLKLLKQQGDQPSFNALMGKILPNIKLYIARRLNISVKKGDIPTGKYEVDDFVDELYINAYDHIHDVKEGQHLLRWLFRKADELLEDTIVEEDFDHFFYENIDNYSKQEWDAMEEKFSTDGDGDLVMEEELNDPSYPKYDYTVRDVFVEHSEEDLIEKIDKERTKKEIHRHIEIVLWQFPLPMWTVFDLVVNQHLLPEEIADIKQIPVEQVERYLADARKGIQRSFESRYLFVTKPDMPKDASKKG